MRVLATTTRDLREEVNRGSFSSELFDRLGAVTVRLPPLREHREDIAFLAEHFYAELTRTSVREPPPSLVAWLEGRDLPGNVRQLRSLVERAVGSGSETAQEPTGASFRSAKQRAVRNWERDFLLALIERAQGNLSRAARGARMDRNHLRELLRRHNVPVRPE